MKSRGKIIAVFFAITSCLYVTAQKADSVLEALSTEPPLEKVYIHYDKEYYVAGETIWFKAYLYSAGLPSSRSNNFYLQLISPEGKIISSKKYPVKGAAVNGNIELPDSIPQGDYHIRALTPEMLNTNQDLFYSKNIFVFNPADKTGNSFSAPKSPSLAVRFFPESGNLVGEILSVIAFKATDSLGRPVGISGVIKTEDGTTITSFKTSHNGMGKVQFRPQAGKKYIATVEINGQTTFWPLPEVASSGINLRTENEKGGKMFLLSRSKKDKDNYNKLLLVAEMDNTIVYENEINFENYFSVKGHLLTDSLPSGILHFTVFDKERKPLAERLTFVNNGEYESNAGIETIKSGTAPKEENIFEINFPDAAQRSCSVAVTDAETSPVITRENIITKFLLTDDLKGNIYDPAWYFQDKNDSTRQIALDNLMLIHGWSRFAREKVFAGEIPGKRYKDNYLVTVTGNIRDGKTNSPVSGGNLIVYLDAEDSVNQHFEVEVDASGKFVIDSLLFFGKATLNYAYKSAQGKERPVNISLDQQPTDVAVEVLPYPAGEAGNNGANNNLAFDEELIYKRYRTSASSITKTKELEPVVVDVKSNKRPIDIVNEKYTSGVFTGLGKRNIDNINEPNNDKSISVYDYIRNFVKQVEVEDNNFVNRKNFSISGTMTPTQEKEKQARVDAITNSPYAVNGGKEVDKIMNENAPGKKFIVATFLNESPTDISFLKTIRMDEVALLKFYDPGFVGAGSGGPGGALSIYTKKDVSVSAGIEKLDHVDYYGFSLSKEFYSPDYSQPGQKQAQEDARTTLYWNPEVYTDAQSKTIRLRFYNNDFSKRLKIIVEGFDASGRLIHVEKIIGN